MLSRLIASSDNTGCCGKSLIKSSSAFCHSSTVAVSRNDFNARPWLSLVLFRQEHWQCLSRFPLGFSHKVLGFLTCSRRTDLRQGYSDLVTRIFPYFPI